MFKKTKSYRKLFLNKQNNKVIKVHVWCPYPRFIIFHYYFPRFILPLFYNIQVRGYQLLIFKRHPVFFFKYSQFLYSIPILLPTYASSLIYVMCCYCVSLGVFIALGDGRHTRSYCFYYFLDAGRASWHIIPCPWTLPNNGLFTMLYIYIYYIQQSTCFNARCIVAAQRHASIQIYIIIGVKNDYYYIIE